METQLKKPSLYAGPQGSRRFSPREIMREAQREVGYRRFVYPKLVEAGKLRQAQADDRIAMMEAVAWYFGNLADQEEETDRLL
jgi:hypothetical protein